MRALRSLAASLLVAVVGGIGWWWLPSSRTWQADADFFIAPRQANPAPDRFGHRAVWSYLRGPSAADPAGFRTLDSFTSTKFRVSGLVSWTGDVLSGDYDFLPAVGVNARDRDIYVPPGVGWTAGAMLVHPARDEVVAVGWRSPTGGKVSIDVDVELAQTPNCGNGIRWSLLHGSERLDGGRIVYGQHGSTKIRRSVSRGTRLYLVVDAVDHNDQCDSTLVSFDIRRTGRR